MKSNQLKIGHNSLISSCLVPFKTCLLHSFESSINSTLQTLFDKADNAKSNIEETQMFEQYNLLKRSQSTLMDSLSNNIVKMPDNISEQISMGDDSISLSIVEEEELEISLAFTQLEAVLDIKYTKYLHALEKRLKVLFAAISMTKANMPLGVASICWIFSQTLDSSTSDVKIKTTLIEFLKKQLAVELLNTYKSIDQKFVQAGILPNIQVEKKAMERDGALKTKPKTDTPQEGSPYNNQVPQEHMQQNPHDTQQMPQGTQQNHNNTQQMPQGTQQNPNAQQKPQGTQQASYNNQQASQGAQPTNHTPGQPMAQGIQQPDTASNFNANNNSTNNNFDNTMQSKSSELVNSIFDLMNSGRGHGQQQHSAEASNIDNNMMDNALNNLSKITSIAAGSTEINKLKEMILDGVKSETGMYYPSLSTQQQNSLDVMGMFYDQVKLDSTIDDNMISSLNAINIPLIRTAINDQSFFENENHPAREYLEKIIYASQKWHGTSIVKKIHKFSSNIASEFDGTTESFDIANEDLESYLRLTDRRAKKSEEKWVNAAKGKEKLEVSRHKVEEVVENVSKTAIPEFVQNVIKYVIQDSLTLSLLRHGEDSEEWHNNINTSTVIAKMANPKTVKELTPKQKIESLHHLNQTMHELGFSENDISKTLSNIKECAESATNDTLDKEIPLQEVASINKNKNKIRKAGSAKIEDLRPLSDKEKSELTKIRLMPYGTIFDFIINQQRDKIRRRLSWFSPVSNKALFVSLLGKRPYEKSLNAIAIDLARKNIVVVKEEKKKYFNNMLGQIFSKLKGLTNT